MPNAREMRLISDYEHVRALANGSGGTLTLESVSGSPPDTYVLVYRCRGIEKLDRERPVYRNLHRVRFRLPSRYPAPSAPPQVQLLTPLFHPHVYPNLSVCLGQWQTSEFLDELVLRIGAMIQYDRRCLNVSDPANEAAIQWAKKNLLLFPTDTNTFLNDEQKPTAQEDKATLQWIEL